MDLGEPDGGKLGLTGGQEGHTDSPRLLPFFIFLHLNMPHPDLRHVHLPERVTSVGCGGSHTVALTVTGRLYTFGLSTNGQLGLGNRWTLPLLPPLHRIIESPTPHPVTSLATVTLVSVSCGESHTAALR